MTPNGPIENTPDGWYVTLEGHHNQLYTTVARQDDLKIAFSENRTRASGEEIVALVQSDSPYSGGGQVGPFPIFSPPQIRRQSTNNFGGLDISFNPNAPRGNLSRRCIPDSTETSPMQPRNLLSQFKRDRLETGTLLSNVFSPPSGNFTHIQQLYPRPGNAIPAPESPLYAQLRNKRKRGNTLGKKLSEP